MLSFQELKNKYKLNDKEFFTYLQLNNWIIVNFDLRNRVSTGLEEILNKMDKRKLIMN